jgi:hypothetical protein
MGRTRASTARKHLLWRQARRPGASPGLPRLNCEVTLWLTLPWGLSSPTYRAPSRTRHQCSPEEVIVQRVATNHEPNGAPEFADRCLAQVAVVATTGGAVSSGSSGSGGIRWTTISPCSKRNYSSHNNLRSMAEKKLEDRSNTSRLSPPPQRSQQPPWAAPGFGPPASAAAASVRALL